MLLSTSLLQYLNHRDGLRISYRIADFWLLMPNFLKPIEFVGCAGIYTFRFKKVKFQTNWLLIFYCRKMLNSKPDGSYKLSVANQKETSSIFIEVMRHGLLFVNDGFLRIWLNVYVFWICLEFLFHICSLLIFLEIFTLLRRHDSVIGNCFYLVKDLPNLRDVPKIVFHLVRLKLIRHTQPLLLLYLPHNQVYMPI